MDLSKLINYAIEHGGEQRTGYEMEFELRFGKYSRISSNIKQNIFFKIYNRAIGKKTYKLIDETFYDTKDKDPIRQRIVYGDLNNLVKNMFCTPKTISLENINQIFAKYKTQSVVKTYVSKSKIMRGSTSHIYKSEIVHERTHDNPPNTENETLKKYKLRCSWLEDMWMYDLTILFINDLKKGKSGIFYEVEIEYNHNSVIKHKYTFDNVLESTIRHINHITTIMECSKMQNIDAEIKYSLYNAVETMERHRLPLLQTAKYSVVDKADGERRFVYINNSGCIFQFNPTEGFINKVVLVKNTKSQLCGTLIDCELIKLINGETFYGFDLIFYKNKDYRNYNLNERLAMLAKTVAELCKLDKSSGYKYTVKKFYTTDVFKNAKKIWQNRTKLYPYELDGLIFTPIRGSYMGNLPNLKYKPLVSIDIRLMYRRDTDFTEFYANGYPIEIKGKVINAYTDHKTKKTYYKSRITLHDNQLKSMGAVNNKGLLGMSGRVGNMNDMVDIVEMEFIPTEKRWKFLRTRPDKDTPNAYKSITSALNAIKDNITIDEISKLKHTKSPFECIAVGNKKCLTKAGFNFTSPTISSPLCYFYRYIYKNILDTVVGKSILVLGCDLCVLNGLVDSGYTDIVIIESNCLEIYGEVASEGYQGLLETLSKLSVGGKNIKIIWGDPNVSNGLVSYTKGGQTELNKYKKKSFDTVLIKSFERSLYNGVKFDQSLYNKYISQVKALVKKNIIGLYLSGSRMMSYLEKQDCLLLKNKELHPLWKASISSKKLTKYTPETTHLFKIKETVKLVDIKTLQNSFISEFQPVVFDINILTVLKDVGITPIKCSTLKTFYPDFKRTDSIRVGDYDIVISDITKYFIATIL
jgi:hypothetical protein